MNIKISSKKYHYFAKQGVRDRKAKRWTRHFVAIDQAVRESYPQMPSPRTSTWQDYISYRLTIMKQAIAVYTTEKYTRLRFDKYVESNRVCDLIAAMVVSNLSALQFFSLIKLNG